MFKPFLFLLSSLGFTAGTGVVGAAPLQVLHRQLGALPFWLMGMGIMALLWGMKLPALAVLFFVNVFLIGSLAEFRKTNWNQALVYIATLAATYGFFILSLVGIAFFTSIDPITQLTSQFVETISLFPELANSITIEELLFQVPSLGLVYLIITLFVTLTTERFFFQIADEVPPKKSMLSNFSMPETFIWVLLAAMIGSFAKVVTPATEMFALNVFNVVLFGYFFQGLAVITKYFQIYRIGRFWRVFWYILFIFQLFIFTSVLGVVDYWADFRSRFKKRAEVTSRNKYKSKLGDS